MHSLRKYQMLAVEHIIAFFRSASYGEKRLYTAPTGSGKSLIELYVLGELLTHWLITPKIEIIAGMLQKLGYNTDDMSEDEIVGFGWSHHLTTPIRLRNRLMAGEDIRIEGLIVDEGHHAEAESYQQILLLCGNPPAIALTATGFRGTPRGTKALRETWGEPIPILSYPEALADKVIAMPSIEIVPLVDDDVIEIQNGEFVVSAVEDATMSRFLDCINLCKRYVSLGRWDKPTMISLPSTDLCRAFAAGCNAIDIPVKAITQSTSNADRRRIFSETVNCECALAQINVVSEGVDLPLRRGIDLSPVFSPVVFLQRFGRLTRPTDDRPEYICTNRNYLRHAYLLDGCLPLESLIAAQAAFPVSSREASRAYGLEAIGRLRPSAMPLANGLQGSVYAVSCVIDNRIVEYGAILHPAKEDVIWAKREITADENNRKAYGRWKKCDEPDGLQGFSSATTNTPLSPAQEAWWRRQAKFYGLDVDAKITRKNFAALPILSDIKVRFR